MSHKYLHPDSLGTFAGIQLLRFFAAFIVVLTHATFYVSSRIDSSFTVWYDGAQGVPVFFVISGFVMTLTARSMVPARNNYKKFMLQRLIRIVPLYWMVNALKIIILLVVPASIFGNPDVLNILLSLFFIPSRNAEGVVETFYGVGWTLNFEMFFYLVFAFALIMHTRILRFVGITLLFASGLSLFREEHWPAVTYLLNPIVLNFLWGVLIAESILAGRRLSSPLSWLLIGLGVLVIFGFPGLKLLGLQYAALVAGLVFLEPVLGKRIPKGLIAGGNASYALYLLHPLVGVLVAVALKRVGFDSAWGALVMIIGASLVVSSLVHVNLEVPITKYLKRRRVHSTNGLN